MKITRWLPWSKSRRREVATPKAFGLTSTPGLEPRWGPFRGQAGLEYMALFAFVAVVLLAASYYFYSSFQVQSRVFQARIAVDKIANAADAVASQGQGSAKQVSVYFPSGIINATARGREVLLVVAGQDGRQTDVYSTTLANLSLYQFPLSESRYLFNVTFGSNGNVSISG